MIAARMAAEDPDHRPLGPEEAEKWLPYYAEASKRRRARGWHRRRDFRHSVRERIRSKLISHLIMGVLLALAAVATTVALLVPRS